MTDFGVEPPPEGCPVPASRTAGERLDGMVDAILAELRRKGVM
jgi:hypothetical protein